jgi:NAD+ synthase
MDMYPQEKRDKIFESCVIKEGGVKDKEINEKLSGKKEKAVIKNKGSVMLTNIEKELKTEILRNHGVVQTEDFDVKNAVRDRINYLKDYVKKSGTKGIVLGISGGVDSATAGKMSQIAMQELREEGYDARFIAMRLPYKVQKDEEEAQASLDFINPDKIVTVDVGNGVDGVFDSVLSGLYENDIERVCTTDFAKGNVKARMRMVSQYAVAGLHGCLVLGTDHNAECVAGFYTKHGDGACDFIVLNGMNKRQVRACAKELGAPEWLWSKLATADLEDDNPQVSDEVALGFKYDEMDDFLEGKEVPVDVEKKIINQYRITQHKRAMPVEFK